MDAASIQVILYFVAAKWRRLRNDRRVDHEGEQWPIGCWICQHDPLPGDAQDLVTPLNASWFLDTSGIRRMDINIFIRFWTVQLQMPWAADGFPIPHQTDFTIGRHRIAMAAFAPYDDSDEFYLETIWGGLHAIGMRATVHDGQLEMVEFFWIS